MMRRPEAASMNLDYLDFDFTEDEEGHCSLDAMASATPDQLAALQAELQRVLAWAHRAFGAPAPLEEGGEWDYELQGVQEVPTLLDVRYDEALERLSMQPGPSGMPRVTLSLTLTGSPAFCDAFRREFD